MKKVMRHSLLSVLVGLAFGSTVSAAEFQIDQAASQAIQTNPDVLAKWHQFGASLQERNVTAGRYLPTLDVVFGTGRETRESPLFNERSYNFTSSRVKLNQNLFEGFATVNETKKLEHASMVRFYEVLDLSESTALEAVKAYVDVYRYRQLVAYAEENYAIHRVTFEKIKNRAASGVSRGVDLETAAGRLALAESNLLTETANLHDVTARYQRIVGSVPPADMLPPSVDLLSKGIPKDRAAALAVALDRAPAVKAATENILSFQRNEAVQKGAYYPRLDAYVERSYDSNAGGLGPDLGTNYLRNTTDVTTYAVTAKWNLFNGFQDLSRQRKAAEEKYSARDLREKVCRDVRQNSTMAFNDQIKLNEQLRYLDQHQLSTDKARAVFRKQFDIGQRTLLDVLDTENEYYTARRNYLNGSQDLLIAYARYQAAGGNLLETLQLKRLDMTPPQPETTAEEGLLVNCGMDAVTTVSIDKEAIYQRALAKEELLAPPPAVESAPAPKAAPKPAAKSKK